jgi:hypothetical protein
MSRYVIMITLYFNTSISVRIFILIIDTSQLELLLDTTLVTPSLQAVSSHVIKNIGKETVTQLRIEHKLIITFAVLLMVVFAAYLTLTLYDKCTCMRNEADEHPHLVYYVERSTINNRS